MTFLADIPGELIAAVIGIAFFLIKMLSGKSDEEPQRPQPQAPARPRGGGASEEERMRKFMEALGLPADAPPIQRREPRPILGHPPERPVPPIVVAPPFKRRVKSAPPPLPPAPPRERSLDELETTTLRVEQIQLPELKTAELPEYHTLASTVTAIPFDSIGDPAPASAASRRAATVRAMLRSAEAVRSAVLLREVLGPPRGLQPRGFTHTFPSL